MPPGVLQDNKGGEDGGRIRWKLSEVDSRPISRRQNKLIGNFKVAAGDVINIRWQVMEFMYIPTRIKRELVRFGMDRDQKG